MSEIPAWIRLACQRWGRQKRRIWEGQDWHGNKDGYAQSLLGRIKEDHEAASQHYRSQSWPEVFFGDGLDVQRSLAGMPEKPYCVLHLQYVWNPQWNLTTRRKARVLELNPDVYYDHLDRAEFWIWARLDVRDTQLTDNVHKIIRGTLREAAASTISPQTRERSAQPLDLAALRRTKLSIAQ